MKLNCFRPQEDGLGCRSTWIADPRPLDWGPQALGVDIARHCIFIVQCYFEGYDFLWLLLCNALNRFPVLFNV